MSIHDLDTPAVLIDVETLHRNLAGTANYCSVRNLALRPHTKTHKIPEIARLQMQYGSPGITGAKLGEAEVMADAGISDILIVYPLWGERNWKRLARLATRVRISVAMDSMAVAAGISQAPKAQDVEIGIRLEFDTGFGCCGLGANAPSIKIAKEVMALPNLRWEGISLYPRHIMGNRGIREQDIVAENAALDELYAKLDAAGIPRPIVSGGNTPALSRAIDSTASPRFGRERMFSTIGIQWRRSPRSTPIALRRCLRRWSAPASRVRPLSMPAAKRSRRTHCFRAAENTSDMFKTVRT